MTNDPHIDRQHEGDDKGNEHTDADEGGSVSEPAANPAPPADDALTSKDTHDTPQTPSQDMPDPN